jgi:ATP-binding protein involved in chromosome partitioning
LSLMKKRGDKAPGKLALRGIEKVDRFIAVASGKGGVGKTTVAVNLALALSKKGLRVGLLDADVYGPSIPVMLGLQARSMGEAGMLVPPKRFGMEVMSVGFLIEEDQPVIWRGPMVSKAITEFLGKVRWGELDYLVVDLPPGTGDPSITISRALPRAGVIIVTTPQAVALADVRKAVAMFRKLDKPILGVVENMAYFSCSHSDEKIPIFGSGGGESLSRESDIPLVTAQPESPISQLFGDLADQVTTYRNSVTRSSRRWFVAAMRRRPTIDQSLQQEASRQRKEDQIDKQNQGVGRAEIMYQ